MAIFDQTLTKAEHPALLEASCVMERDGFGIVVWGNQGGGKQGNAQILLASGFCLAHNGALPIFNVLLQEILQSSTALEM